MRKSLDTGRGFRMVVIDRLVSVAFLGFMIAGPAAAQVSDSLPRRLSVADLVCDSLQRAATDSVYEADAVDEPVQARRLPIEDMPFRAREVLTGRSVFRFIVDASGRIERCSIEADAAPQRRPYRDQCPRER